MYVTPKKNLGQHFLKDQNIARKIVDALQGYNIQNVLEIGPGTGVLTKYLLNDPQYNYRAVEIDRESISYLELHYPEHKEKFISADFLKMDINPLFNDSFAIIGNFPYNISSQIFFKTLEHRHQIPVVVGMIQKEVAERLASKCGNKQYGILSVLLQAYYDIEYLFTVDKNVFNPPPKVQSAVIRLTRNNRMQLDCDEKLFKVIIKTSFNQRRKTLRNSLKTILLNLQPQDDVFALRPEQLSVEDFIALTKLISKYKTV